MTDPRAADVKFLVGPQKRVIEGNKWGLAYASTVFHRMFFSNFPSENEIVVPDVDAEAFELMINSISGRDVILNANNIAQVYYAAEKYDLPFLRRVCKTFLVNSIDSNNALALLNTFQHYNDSEINEKCLSIILDEPLSFLKKQEFLNAPADVIRCIFKPTYINCSMQDIKNALLSWMKKNGSEIVNHENWFEAVENQLKITKEELEIKMKRQNLFYQFNYKMAIPPTIFQCYKNSFILEDTQLFLQGFGLIMGKVSNETFTVYIYTEKGLIYESVKITVEKIEPKDKVTIQDVFFKKIAILHDTPKKKFFFDSSTADDIHLL
jgi:BTB/POZ domain